VAGRAAVDRDGGLRRGTDAFKALALGARAVVIGRPACWGLAGAGETGVRLVVEMRRGEVDATPGRCGRPTGASVDRECLVGGSPLAAVFPPAAPFRERAATRHNLHHPVGSARHHAPRRTAEARRREGPCRRAAVRAQAPRP
jgi:hypothetical protein